MTNLLNRVATSTHTRSNRVSKLIKYYCEQGLLAEARQLFDEIADPDVVTWTSMISGFTSKGRHDLAWVTFREMQRARVGPNAYTISNVLKTWKCVEAGGHSGKALVHGLALKIGVDGSIFVQNGLVDAYASSREATAMDDAYKVFERLTMRSVVAWTALIAGHTRRGNGKAAILEFQRMLQDGVEMNEFSCSIAIRTCASLGSSTLGKQLHAVAVISALVSSLPVANSLIDMYCRCVRMSDAKLCFNQMPERDLISWNTMIAGFERIGSLESLQLFSQMDHLGLKPNCFTFTSIVASCANAAVLRCGQQVHAAIIRRGFERNLPLANALIDMYSKCGSIACSRKIFDEMKDKDLVSWTAMMVGYGNHGHGKEAIQLFNEMVALGFQLDRVVFMGLICACSHAGLIDEGMEYFNSMNGDYGLSPDLQIYGCVVDLLGRGGRLQEAYELVNGMPYEPDDSIWGALLGACKVHRYITLAKLVAQKKLELRPQEPDTFILLSNIYAAGGEWTEFAKTRRRMKETGNKKEAGRSWIELRDHVCSFVMGEIIDPHMESVYEELKSLEMVMKDIGYVPHLDCSFHH